MDRLDAMAAFVAVAELRGFAPAARRLGLSPSAVTRLVAALEERLSIRLLTRTTRTVTLTDGITARPSSFSADFIVIHFRRDRDPVGTWQRQLLLRAESDAEKAANRGKWGDSGGSLFRRQVDHL